jgi:hypothetical protein
MDGDDEELELKRPSLAKRNGLREYGVKKR